MGELSKTEFLKAIIYPRSTIALVAKYAFDVLELFYAVPVFVWVRLIWVDVLTALLLCVLSALPRRVSAL
jgi:hypothetical protein